MSAVYESPHTYVDVSEMNGGTDNKSGSRKCPLNKEVSRILVILVIILMCLTFIAIAMAGVSLGQYSSLNDRLDNIEKTKEIDDVTEPPQLYSSCKEIKEKKPEATSGVYKMILGGTAEPLDLYCDMTTAGGGWTLVYSHGYTDYQNFQSNGNAVTPIPNWTKGTLGNFKTDVRVSTTPPLNEMEREALGFHLWNNIGSEFMVKSTINNWIKCKPGSGSLVTMTAGSITCEIVHEVLDCSGQVKVPNNLRMYPHGPSLNLGNHFYYWDGDTSNNWPTADPCGENKLNQKKGIADPNGAIFVK